MSQAEFVSASPRGFAAAAGLLVLTVLAAYSNHFSNPFELDDTHTIVGNESILDLRNVARFFTDARTFSTLPTNQSYRPGTTTLNAIDTWLGGTGKPEPRAFHISIFLSFLVLGALLYHFLLRLLGPAFDRPWVRWVALTGTGLFLLHTANAETINYVIARADSFSTLMVLVAFVVYLRRPARSRSLLYLIPFAAGVLVKETALMFAPLLLAYLVLVREGLPLRPALGRALGAAAPAFLLSAVLVALSLTMTPATLAPGGAERWRYLLTQPFVLLHYFGNFIFPVNLAIELDWTAVSSPFESRVFVGVAFVALALLGAAVASRQAAGRPIAFGILWFFIALGPTSSIIPLAEVVNHHRPFFPYVGLTLAACGLACVVLVRHEERLRHSLALRTGIGAAVVLLLATHAWGVHRRNEVWSSAERVWEDAARKGPRSARILMNYANTLMGRADYAGALDYFERARAISPNYSYVHINLGVLRAAMGDAAMAETHFTDALALGPENPESYAYYSVFLGEQGRKEEALAIARRGLAVSPTHVRLNALVISTSAGSAPTPEDLLDLSLRLYQERKYEESLAAARNALTLRPEWDLAWNNICAAQNSLGRWDEAIAAGEQAVRLNPDNQLARNNLAVARAQKESAGRTSQSAPPSN